MKKITTLKIIGIGLVIFASFFFTGCATRNKTVNINGVAQTPVDLNDVIAALKVQYEIAKEQLNGIKITPDNASVTVQVTNTYTAAGDISVLIFKPTYTNKVLKSSSVTFDLQAPQADAIKSRVSLIRSNAKPDSSLAKLIISAAKAYDKLDPTPIPGLNKQDFVIDVIFSIENDANLGLTFKVLGTGVDASYEYDRAVQHELKLTCEIKQ
ncbi:hypothetical protein SAMN05216490_0749 [Mucilaginibacter mallensis]|uniref:Lipoprotein n=1 Tax=Mucilaginibacter mallensis TaxID=652787 RepID=A0A1H1QDZ6_MUCMA|nr:hypothetical protein [Mucilaginibacter mallensis]SDS21533.1 hypothetical protein SAMN05216490_0749 [Mucilaginibacter mallensis]